MNPIELRMKLDAEEYFNRDANNSLFPKGIFKVVLKNDNTHEVNFWNKRDSFSLTFADNDLYDSIYIGQVITMK